MKNICMRHYVSVEHKTLNFKAKITLRQDRPLDKFGLDCITMGYTL
jgi:hypothetical protein